MKYRLFIPSIGRPEQTAKHPMLEQATVFLKDTEVPAYEAAFRKADRKPLAIEVGNGFGLSKARNDILSLWRDEDAIFMADDDVSSARYIMKYAPINIDNPWHMLEILQNTARLALDAGSPLFGYAPTPRPIERKVWMPFDFRGRLEDSVGGYTDRRIRYDEMVMVNTSIDAMLESIRLSRLCLTDLRYSWNHDRWTTGGLAAYRTKGRIEQTARYLQAKWGRGVVEFQKKARHDRTSVDWQFKVNIK